jgi:hypothetical protein
MRSFNAFCLGEHVNHPPPGLHHWAKGSVRKILMMERLVIRKKFLNILIKKGKKRKTEKLFHNFFLSLNSILLNHFWYRLTPTAGAAVNYQAAQTAVKRNHSASYMKPLNLGLGEGILQKALLSRKGHNKAPYIKHAIFLNFFLDQSRRDNDSSETNNNFFMVNRQVINNRAFAFKSKEAILSTITHLSALTSSQRAAERLVEKEGALQSEIRDVTEHAGNQAEKALKTAMHYYFTGSRSFAVRSTVDYIIHQIIFLLLPTLAVRMTAVKSKGNLKKKGRKRKPFGVPILLTAESRITYAFGFF